ncbi:MAG: EamA family transporter [Candidatus Aenigmarchaeota archaeon]|nr:EamA family transporter [Candidatus Aenigmarchaeota archaeon]
MFWLILSLLTALFTNLRDITSKKSLEKVDVYTASFSGIFFTLPFLLPLLFFIEIPKIGTLFFPTLIIAAVLYAASYILYSKALSTSDISVTVPMASFTPAFMLITSPILINELPNTLGIIGVLLGFLGSYVLNIRELHKGFFEPFKALLRGSGPRLMLIVAFIWSIAANLDKIGLQNSSPIFWLIANNMAIAAVMLPIMLHKSTGGVKGIRTNLKWLLPIGLSAALMSITFMLAINTTLVAYVISIKRLIIVFGVIAGYMVFGEKNIKERLIGSIIMIIGVLLITLS